MSISNHQQQRKAAMIYNRELVQHKTQNAGTGGLQVFCTPQDLQTKKYLQRCIGDNSTIHGMRYVAGTAVERGWVRVLWAAVVLCAVGGCVCMYVILSQRHNRQQLKTVVETSQLPVYKIEFPSVAVCPWNHINWMRVKAAEERFLPPLPDELKRAAFHELIIGLEQLYFGRFDHLEPMVKQNNSLGAIDDICISELAGFLAFRCEELFVECTFEQISIDCCKIFTAERTDRGVCLVSNSLISEESRKKKLVDDLYPWRVAKAGEDSGLKFTLRFNSSYQRPENPFPFIVNVMVKESQQWSVQMVHTLYPFTRNFISIKPQITVTSENTRRVQPEKRQCLFPDERSANNIYDRVEGLPYNRVNCIAACKQHYLLKACNCTMPLFFPPTANKYRECKALDLVCLYNNRANFSYIKVPIQDDFLKDDRRGLTCNCMKNCNSMVYLLTLNAITLNNVNQSVPIIKADIYYSQHTMTKYATKLEYTMMDLLANFGGILGLCLGASMLSFAEVLYVLVKAALLFKAERHVIWRTLKLRWARQKPRISAVAENKQNNDL